MLSGLSLADNIAVIAVQALPIYEQDLSNSNIYNFGNFTLNQAQDSTSKDTTVEKSSSKKGL